MDEAIQSKCGLCVAHSLHDVYSYGKDLQHRGREGFGIAAIGPGGIDVLKLKGVVSDAKLKNLLGIFPANRYDLYMLHVRYATQGREDRILEDSHPHVIGGTTSDYGSHIHIRGCESVMIHNGQADLEGIANDEISSNACDTKILLDYYKRHNEFELMKNINGSFVMAIADKSRAEVIIMRDRFGIKPGYMCEKDGKICVASEDSALKNNGGEKTGEDLRPGVIYYLSAQGTIREIPIFNEQPKHCFFEWNYIANVASTIDEVSVHKVRRELGRSLAREFHPKGIDIITYLPECPIVAAETYAEELNRKIEDIFYKLKGERAFQGTTKQDRKDSIKRNLYIYPDKLQEIRGKNIVVVDDSTIRGNNSAHARELLQEAGANKISFINYTSKIGIIGEDRIPRGCLFGVDMPPEDDFVVRTKNKQRNREDWEINRALKMEIYYLSPEGMFQAFERAGMPRKNLCSYCIGGKHPFE